MEALFTILKQNSFTILLVITVAILLKYLHGRKKNLAMARGLSAMLEDLFDPVDKEYTWIGGLAGFKAVYELKGNRQLKATLVMMPRHSLLFLPFSLLLFGKDKLFLVFKEADISSSEGHILSSSYKKIPKAWLPSPSEFDIQDSVVRKERPYRLLAKDEETMRVLRHMLDGPGSSAILHAAFLPLNKTAYFALNPLEEGFVAFLKQITSIVN